MTFDEIREMALSFPGVEEHIVFGGPLFRVGKRFLASTAKIDKNSLVLKMPDQREREFLLATKPEVYYVTEHYASFNSILVRITEVDPDELRHLFEVSWRSYAPKRLVASYKTSE